MGEGLRSLLSTLDDWTEHLAIPRLSQYGLNSASLKEIARRLKNNNNPAPLSAEEIERIPIERM